MRSIVPWVLVVSLTATGVYAKETAAPATDDQKVLYALGFAVSGRLTGFGLTAAEAESVAQGLKDGMLGRDARVEMTEWGPKIDGWLGERRSVQVAKLREEGRAYLDKVAGEAGAVKTDSGMVYFEIAAGDGPAPGATDTVRVHYTGRFTDGRVFDTSREGEPATFAVNGVVPCFSEAILRMKVGGKSKAVCTDDLAYGERGYPPNIPPGAALVFDVELLGMVSAAAEGVAAPPTP